MEAPSALAAALASSAALPRPPRARLTRPTPRALRGYVNPYVNGYANPYVNPPPRVAYPTAPPALASAQARAPLGERMRARLIHPTAGRLYGSRLRRRSTNSAVRLPHGALAISAHLRRAALFDGDRRQPRRGQGMNGSLRRR